MNRDVKKLKVFHGIVNYGTQAGLLAQGLRSYGINALSVSYSDNYKRLIDVELLHGGNTVNKAINHVRNGLNKLFWFFRYNTFHFYYGTSLMRNHSDLPLYRLFGKKVVMHYLGNDVQEYRISTEKYKWTNMQGYIGTNDPVLHDQKIRQRLAYETRYAGIQFVCAPCYSEFVRNSVVLPLAIDIERYEYADPPGNKTLIAMHAPTHRASKGTDFIIAAINRLISDGYGIKLNLVENTTHDTLKEEYRKADFFIDQVLSGWYGTASIEAMALGRPVISSLRKSYFENIDYGEKIPIIHADPDSIYDSIRYMIENREKLPEIGMASRRFVEAVHDSKKISHTLISYYQQMWSNS
jgi:glycosyltransferase involved in cell wall biosynthesis